MTNELETQFFDTFGIGTYYKYLLIDKTSRFYNEKLLDKTNFIDFVKSGKDYLLLKVIKYSPQITDHILLELICMLNNYGKNDTWAVSVENLKDCILMNCIKVIKEKDLKEMSLNNFKHKVRTLFEGG